MIAACAVPIPKLVTASIVFGQNFMFFIGLVIPNMLDRASSDADNHMYNLFFETSNYFSPVSSGDWFQGFVADRGGGCAFAISSDGNSLNADRGPPENSRLEFFGWASPLKTSSR